MQVVPASTELLSSWRTIASEFHATQVVDRCAIERDRPGPAIPVRSVPRFHKDYDSANDPATWKDRFDVRRWGVLIAQDGAVRVGGAVLAWRTPGCDMLRGRDDLVVLWDLRVTASARNAGLGRRLLAASIAWARERRAAQIEIETQDTNVAACRLYASAGCVLSAVNTGVYATSPHETQLLWTLDL